MAPVIRRHYQRRNHQLTGMLGTHFLFFDVVGHTLARGKFHEVLALIRNIMISCIYYGTVNFPPIESLLHTERFAMRYENENESNSIQSPHANVKQWVENICFQVSPKRKKIMR